MGQPAGLVKHQRSPNVVVLHQILLVIVCREAFLPTEMTRLLRRGHSIGRNSVDVNVEPPVDQRAFKATHPEVGFGGSKAIFLSHLDDDLAFCTSLFDVSHSLVSRVEWKDPIHNRANDSGINERADLAQLAPICSHEKE